MGCVKVACAGDSITYGYGVTERAENCYPAVLGRLLGDGYDVRNFGSNGTAAQKDSDAPYVKLSKYRKSLEYDADILVFMMGSNDSNIRNWKGCDAYRDAVCSLIDSYAAGEGRPHVFLCTPAKVYKDDDNADGIANYDLQPAAVEKIAETVRNIAAEREYDLIDINRLTAEHREWFSLDGVHPDMRGAAAIAESVYWAIKNRF